jgi:inorganic pyrophosphatase
LVSVATDAQVSILSAEELQTDPTNGDGMDLSTLPTFAHDDVFHVVVECPRGSSLKLKFDADLKALSISRPLPLGVSFPFDWGFIPSTHGPDDDPLDAMLLWDVAAYPGVVVPCRALGVLQVEQNRRNHDRSERLRNDRIMGMPVDARREQLIDAVDALSPRIREELEQFTIAATALEGKDVRVLGWGDVPAALALIRQCQRS